MSGVDPRAAARERDLRRKQRQREGRLVVQVELHEDAIDALVERRRLNEWFDRDRAAISAAIAKLVSDWADAVTDPTKATRGQD